LAASTHCLVWASSLGGWLWACLVSVAGFGLVSSASLCRLGGWSRWVISEGGCRLICSLGGWSVVYGLGWWLRTLCSLGGCSRSLVSEVCCAHCVVSVIGSGLLLSWWLAAASEGFKSRVLSQSCCSFHFWPKFLILSSLRLSRRCACVLC
jgi:hypothetical protein